MTGAELRKKLQEVCLRPRDSHTDAMPIVRYSIYVYRRGCIPPDRKAKWHREHPAEKHFTYFVVADLFTDEELEELYAGYVLWELAGGDLAQLYIGK